MSRQVIAGSGRREREPQHGREARLLAADWLLESGIDTGPAVYVHAGGCHMAGKRCRGVPRDVALRALAAPDLRADARIDAWVILASPFRAPSRLEVPML
ncbi:MULTISPECIES: DUF6233 domain-containing protein [unclassified Streptomyces]|uniref:DUF6233 domain-containing protein n=1 Tax=unclassified Streptomyces TaxID=2593676 RepID=UPI00338F1DB0